ncbi:hypothetical protein O5408_25450, partial [Escherichia coli]|nr:hypothetical protein [Escherichia coli]
MSKKITSLFNFKKLQKFSSALMLSKYLEGTRCFISLFKLAVLIYSEIVSPSFFARRLISLATLLF